MLFKPLRGCALFRSPTSKSQFTKYVFGSQVQMHKLHSFFLDREGTSSLPLPTACSSLRHWKRCALFFFFREVPPWGWMQDGYSINQASSRYELCGAKCSPRGQAQTRDIGSRWKEDRREGVKGRGYWGRCRGCFLIWWYEARNRQICFSPSKQAVIAVKICLFSGIHLHKSENIGIFQCK